MVVIVVVFLWFVVFVRVCNCLMCLRVLFKIWCVVLQGLNLFVCFCVFVCVLPCFVVVCGVREVLWHVVWLVLGCVLLCLCVLRSVCLVSVVLCDVCMVCVVRVCVCACGG